MAPVISPVVTSDDLPASTTVVVIGGGIVGLTTALVLAERGIPVTVLEKGTIAGEQSSRNQGWIRKTSRSAADLPLAVASDPLWQGMAERVGTDVGYRQTGVMFLAGSKSELAAHEAWIKSVQAFALDVRTVSPDQIDALVPGGKGHWAGGIYCPSDGRAEPTMAPSAIATAAIRKGAVIVENCAVRTLSLEAGKVCGVVTERGEIRCDQVVLAAGMGARRFLGNLGIGFPTLPLVLSAIRTAPIDGPTDIAVGGPDFSFRKRLDGGYTITQRSAVEAPITLDHLLIGRRYLPALRSQRQFLRVSLGRDFFRDLMTPRRWKGSAKSPFENARTIDPPVNDAINAEAMANVRAAWPVFDEAVIAETWAGMMDITPDSLPVIDTVPGIPGLTLATGFSGHGFGTAPAAGHLAADLLMSDPPIVDPSPYRLSRF